MELEYIIGGVSSGKTAFGLQKLLEYPSRYYLATGVPSDEEMNKKIKIHIKQRENKNIKTIEEPRNLKGVWEKIDSNGVCLLDCLTLWGSQLIEDNQGVTKEKIEKILEEQFCFSDMKFKKLIIITNELGMGGVWQTQKAREYQNKLGFINQWIGEKSHLAWSVLSGIPNRIK